MTLKFNLVVSDPPWNFSDKLTMSDVKRGASSQYEVLSDNDIINLDIKSIVADDAVLILWVPSSKLQVGLDTVKNWGFEQTQTFIWVKTKKTENLYKDLKSFLKKNFKDIKDKSEFLTSAFKFLENYNIIDNIDFNDNLSMFMGRLFRQTHEIALIGKRGKPYASLDNKSQRSVIMETNLKHSAKPEGLQDRLDLMFPTFKNKLELFARRQREGYYCIGNESPMTLGEDIRVSIQKLKNTPRVNLEQIPIDNIVHFKNTDAHQMWHALTE